MGYFDETIDPTLRIPKTSKALERQIGAFFIAWAVLESELDIAFSVVFRTDPSVASSVYANLGTQAKIDALMSGIDAQRLMLGARAVKSAHAILERIRELLVARNTLAHFRMVAVVDDSSNRPGWRITRLQARKQQSLTFHPSSVSHWGRLTKLVISSARAFRRRTHSLHETLKRFSDSDVGDKVIIYQKDPPVLLARKRRPVRRP